jgi:hypothetical protein
MRGARRAWLYRGTQPPPTPDSAPPTASCSCAASLSDLAAPYLPPLPLRVTSLHTLHIAQLLVIVMHSSSSFSCCWSRACFGLATSQVPPWPSSPSYRRARPCCPPCGSAPSRHTSAPSAHARNARVLGPHRAAAHASESALLAPGRLPPLGSRPCARAPTLPACAPCLLQRLFLPSSHAQAAPVPAHACSRVARARSEPQTHACTGPMPRLRSALRQRSSSTPMPLTSVSPAQPAMLRTCRATSTSTLLLHATSSRCSRSGTGHAATTPCVRAHRLRSSQPPAPEPHRAACCASNCRPRLQHSLCQRTARALRLRRCRPRTWPPARLPRALVLAGPHAARPEPRAPTPPRSGAALPRARPHLSPRRSSQLRLDPLRLAEPLPHPKPPRSPQRPAPASRPPLGPCIPLVWAARLPLGRGRLPRAPGCAGSRVPVIGGGSQREEEQREKEEEKKRLDAATAGGKEKGWAPERRNRG